MSEQGSGERDAGGEGAPNGDDAGGEYALNGHDAGGEGAPNRGDAAGEGALNGEDALNSEDALDDERALDREAEEVTLAVMAASRLIVALSARALAAVDVSLTLPQLRSLVALHGVGPIKLVAMAATLGVNASTALRMVERLDSLGLVDRRVNPDNRRELVLSLTPAGRDLVDEVLGHRRAEIRALVARLPAPARTGLVPALRALTTAADGLDLGADPTAEADRLAGVLDDPLNPAP
jgi:DNA-binding MarR family transcriptional regulator